MSSIPQVAKLSAAVVLGMGWPLFAPGLVAFVSTASFALLTLLPWSNASTLVLAHRVVSATVSAVLVGALFAAVLAFVARRSGLLLLWLAFVAGTLIGSFLFWPIGKAGVGQRLADLSDQFTLATWVGPVVVGGLVWLFRRMFAAAAHSVHVAP